MDAVKVNPKDERAVRMVIRMDALFAIDRDARERGLSSEERQVSRREHAPAWVAEIREACQSLLRDVLPKSTVGQAAQYTLNEWAKLTGCLNYAEVELSNNLAENSMRPVALGRKNWLHVGSEKSGPKVAAILSVVESCRRLGLSVKEYLGDVLPGLSNRKLNEVPMLTPANWARYRS